MGVGALFAGLPALASPYPHSTGDVPATNGKGRLPGGSTKGALPYSGLAQERCSAQAAGWSWWRACSASSITPTLSMWAGRDRSRASSLAGVSTGTLST